MALSKKPVNGMKDILPAEMEIRDYVTSVIKDTYRSFGFTPIETPCMENIANLTSKQGGENEKLIFKVMKRGEKLNLETAKEESDVVDCAMTLQCHFQDIIQTMPTTCHRRLRHFRWAVCGEQTDLREAATDSLHSVI